MSLRLVLYIAIAALLGTCSSTPTLLEQVLEVGELRVVSRDSPTAYVDGPDGPSGPEYDLARAFAEYLGVELVLETVQSVPEVLPHLISGKAHMAAAGLSITDSRREYVNFGHPYELVDMHLVYKLGTGKPRSLDEVIGRPIEVVAGTSHADMLASLQQSHPELSWTENADVEVANLLAKVAAGDVDFTIADSTEFNIQRHFYPDLRVALDLELGDPLAWAFPKESGDSLLSRADDFLIEYDREGLLARVRDRYYGHTDKFDYVGTRNFIRHYESRLPRYRQMFEEAAAQWGLDWRLLAAIAYQESHWRAGAVSPTGVRGIMMLTEDTARYLGIDDRVDPRNSIFGGAQYYARQTERVADSVGEPDRAWMALAAYNVGFNHIKDARQIVEWKGGNPDAWVDISEALPLLAQREWYSRVPFGYARGWEPVLYVNNIRAYYNILQWLTANEEAELREFDLPDDIAEPATEAPAQTEQT
jgi:membrane-bound lytic murein transglycosylase F